MKNSFHTIKRALPIVAFSLLLLLDSQSMTAQNAPNNYQVEGWVRDSHTKEPIHAAQIDVPNKSSAVTDETGKFTIDLTSGEEIVRVTAFDYGQVEIPVQGKKQIVIDLYPEVFNNYFKEIQLPTGSLPNTSLSSSVKSTEDIRQIIDVSADAIIQTSLGGDLRSIGRSGHTGAGNALFIRGFNSLNVNAQPLFVVDGVIWNNLSHFQSIHQGLHYNPLEDIDVNDIESISVLKDGTSIYGSKAANGVILITTKWAKSMVTKIGLNVFFGMITKPEQTPVMSNDEYRMFAGDLAGSLPQGIPGTVNLNFLGNPSLPRNKQYYNQTDWNDEVYHNGMASNYMVNVEGGDERAMYYFSVGYTDVDGVIKETDMQRINARFNVDARLAKMITTKATVAFSRLEKTWIDDGIDFYSSPTWQAQIKAPFLSPYLFNTSGEKTQQLAFADEFGIANPAGIIQYSQNKQKKYQFSLGLLPELTILPELTLRSQFDYNVNNFDEAYFLPMSYSPERDIFNKGISKNRLMSQVAKNAALFSDSRLSYHGTFGQDAHHLKAILGFRYEVDNYEMDYIDEHNSGSNSNTMITGFYEFLSVNGANNTTKRMSNYVSLDYDYHKKYFLSAAFSMDASSRFGKKTEDGISMLGVSWGLFPSINAAWLFSSEKFMRPVSMINFGKIRVGYGISGNDAIPDYESMAYLRSARFLERANGLVIAHIENEKIQWEQTKRANAGIDLVLLNNRVNLSFDVFQSKTDQLLILQPLPETVSKGYYWDNGGSMENKGYELSFDWKTLNLKDFQWNLGFSAGHYKNEIKSLVNENGYFITDVYGGEVITQVGSPAGLFYGYKTDGIFTTQAAADEAALKQEVGVSGDYLYFNGGDVRFADTHPDGIIDEKDKQVIGDPNPDFYGTINSSFAYKRFKLDASFSYSYGNDVYNYHRSMLESGLNFSNQSKAMLNRWIADGQQTDQPKAVYGDPMANSRFSDRWIEDGSYLKLKNVTLSYQLPLKNDFIRGITVWASANNVFTITDYLGRDPEFSVSNSPLTQGIDAGFLPASRSYYWGLRVDL